MSLINEALERARQEAVRRQAADRGVPPPPLPRASRGERVWWKVAAGLMGAALVVSLVALALVLTGERSPRVASSPAAADAAPVPEPPRETPPGPQNGSEGSQADPPAKTAPIEPEPQPATPRPTSPARAIDTTPPPTPIAAPKPDAAPEPTPAEPTPAEPARIEPARSSTVVAREPEPAAEEARPNATGSAETLPVYLQRIELADGAEIQLDGIAWSATGPFTLLNGRVVGIGEIVEGYEVVAISPEEVELRGVDGSIILRLK